ERLREAIPHLPLYRELAKIRCDCELPFDIDELEVKAPDLDGLRELYTRLELFSLIKRRLPSPEPGAVPASDEPEAPRRYETVLTERELDAWIERITASPLVGLAIESDDPDYMRAQLVGLALSIEAGEAAYVPLAHRSTEAPEQLDRDAVLERLRSWLESDAAAKVVHDGKRALHVLARHGITLRGVRHDTMLESYVLNSVATRHDLDSIASKYLGIRTVT